MDDLAGPSFFDFTSSTQSGLDTVIKHDAFDSTAWIQGCHDPSGLDSHSFSSVTFQHTQVMKSNEFLHNPHLHQGNASLESLMSMAPDPLEMILNEPKVEPIKNNSPFPISSNGSLNNQSQSTPSCSGFNITSMQPEIYTYPPAVVQDTNLPINAATVTNVATESSQTVPVSQGLPTIAASEVKEKIFHCSETNPKSAPLTEGPQFGESNNPTVPKMKPLNTQVTPKEIDPEKDLNLYITNVVTSFRVRCHLNLRRIAQEGINVIFQKESKVMFSNFKVINVLAVCKMPYHINIVEFSNHHRSKYLSYEPELHPAVTYRLPEWKVTFKIFSTGSITLTCPVVARIPEAVKHVYPMVKEFFRLDKPNDLSSRRKSSNDLEEDDDYESS